MSVTIGSKDHTIKTDEGVAINAELDTQTEYLKQISQSVELQKNTLEESKKQTNLLQKIYNPE